ncbi:uncharacterized protein LOC110708799 [Chenopodium quinoa]|uniref:uncharacterized protein LOC110708799 n=1 Tax=Chenopodium quinoa TaxID=63459 RepID=UPI000B791F4B|nr:uncharacterized protein LOC110708799 [Chenopodium quinoa]
MASSSVTSIFSLLLISSILSAVSARPGLPFHPCNTLIVSTYSFSFLPQNPNSDIPNNPHFIVVSADLRPLLRHHQLRPRRFMPFSVVDKTQKPEFRPEQPINERPEFLPLGFSSLRERTKDILSVVASLLFGAACGALTAGTMYLIWSLFNHGHGSYRSLDGFNSDSDDDNDDDDIFNPKKPGYVAIPASPVKGVDSAPVPVVAVAAPVPAPAKESA